MAKMKAKAKKKPTTPIREESVRVRMTTEFKVWMEGLAVHERRTVASLIERALVEVAKRSAYPAPPPER